MQEKLKVLVVDDEPDNLDLLYRTFRRDFKVFSASSGAEALETLEAKGEMAVIISDQRMPKMSGTEFLGYTVDRYPDTIRIVLTGYTDVEDLVSAINAGKVFKYITKPWKPKTLKETIVQAAQTYTAVKRRTLALSRALKQESLNNSITSVIRSSLDYNSTLQSVTSALGKAVSADFSVLYSIGSTQKHCGDHDRLEPFTYCQDEDFKALLNCLNSLPLSKDLFSEDVIPLDASSDRTGPVIFSKTLEIEGRTITSIVVPLLEKETLLARVCLCKATEESQWTAETIELLTRVTDQVTLAIAHAKLYQQIQHQSLKMQTELEVARQIQSNLLRQSYPETPGLKIQARCQPAREVGGDFFEVFVHPQGDVWLAVGDVSGKGVPAALFMSSAISVLRRELAQEKSPDPSWVMSSLNHSLADDLMSSNYFITMVLIRYSRQTGKLVYANAGHVYPVIWPHRKMVAQRESRSCEEPMLDSNVDLDRIDPTYLDVRGVPIGILPTWDAQPGEITLSSGDIVLLTTDGITEASMSETQGPSPMLNQEGLWALLQEQPADFDIDNLLAHIHSAEAEQEDDQTLLSLEVMPC